MTDRNRGGSEGADRGGPGPTVGSAFSGRETDRVAQRAAEREQHARVVVERTGDPQYVQRRHGVDHDRVLWDPASEAGQALQEHLAGLREAFRAKFGREPGPDDPVFFDPEADDPRRLGLGKAGELWSGLARRLAERGEDPAYALAAADVGYLVTDRNRHLFTAHEVEAFLDAVESHQRPMPTGAEGLEWDGVGEVPDPYAVAADDLRLPGIVAGVADRLRDVIEEILVGADDDWARQVVDGELAAADASGDPAASGLLIEALFKVLGAWLVGIRERDRAMVEAAVRWAWAHSGSASAEGVAVLADVLIAGRGEGFDTNEASRLLDRGLLPAMIHLAAGAVASAGAGDSEWLRSLDPDT
jgi:hypothetical protein